MYIKTDVKRQVFSCLRCLQDSDNRCGDTHWRAANNKGSKSAKLDETGLAIAGQTKMKQISVFYLNLNLADLTVTVVLTKTSFIYRLQAWLGSVGSEYVSGGIVWLCKLYSSQENDTSWRQVFLGGYSLQILEVGEKGWWS